MVIGTVHLDWTQHGVDGLGPVGDELGLMPSPAVNVLATMTGIQAQQVLQQPGTQLGHRGADRQFHHRQPLSTVGGKRGRREGGQPGYLGGEGRLERAEEPPFSAPVPVGLDASPAANGDTGLALQIASLTSTSSPTICLNCL